MIRAECMVMLNSFKATFGKNYSQETRDRVFERVKHVPSKFVQDITERIEGFETHPSNIGLAILRAWFAVDKTAANENDSKGCSECDGDGTIVGYLKNPQTGEITTHSCSCRRCYPDAQYTGTRQSVQNAGFMVCPSSDPAVQARWWVAFLRNGANRMKQQVSGGGNVAPGGLLADFDRMRAAVEPREMEAA